MKKIYEAPSITVTNIALTSFVCTSTFGVENTGNLTNSVSSEETEEYLSRRRGFSCGMMKNSSFS